VLLCVARDPDVRLRDIADLVDAGYVQRERHGRRNRYVVNHSSPMLRHVAQDGQAIGGLLQLLQLAEGPRPEGASTPSTD
jgi:hypothetical protein